MLKMFNFWVFWTFFELFSDFFRTNLNLFLDFYRDIIISSKNVNSKTRPSGRVFCLRKGHDFIHFTEKEAEK